MNSESRGLDDRDRPQDEVAGQPLQDDIAALLRRSAQMQDAEAKMPDDIAARIRSNIDAELGASGRGSTVRGVAQLPVRPARSVDDHSEDATMVDGRAVRLPKSGATDHSEHARPSSTSSNVTSLDAHRRKRMKQGAAALGAAAAVAIGAVGTQQMMVASDNPKHPAASDHQYFAAKTRVTDSNTAYSSESLSKDATNLPNLTAPTVSPAQAEQLGKMATEPGIKACMGAIEKAREMQPEKIYADMGTYNNNPAVIVVLTKGSEKKVWVVNRTCTSASDVEVNGESI